MNIFKKKNIPIPLNKNIIHLNQMNQLQNQMNQLQSNLANIGAIKNANIGMLGQTWSTGTDMSYTPFKCILCGKEVNSVYKVEFINQQMHPECYKKYQQVQMKSYISTLSPDQQKDFCTTCSRHLKTCICPKAQTLKNIQA